MLLNFVILLSNSICPNIEFELGIFGVGLFVVNIVATGEDNVVGDKSCTAGIQFLVVAEKC